METEEVDNNEIISIFVDKELLEKTSLEKSNMDLNETNESLRNEREIPNLVEFELYGEENNNENDGAYGDSTEDLKMTISVQKVTNGYIINSILFLPEDNYNCIVNNYCIICDKNCINNEHFDDEIHCKELKDVKPLEKYDISIIRKINGIYHCGVCNETIQIDITPHFESKTHENKLLFAINKASDIMFDADLHKNRTDGYHFNVNSIIEHGNYFTDSTKPKYSYNDYINNDIDYDDNDRNYDMNYDFDDDINQNQGQSYASMAKTPKIENPIFINVVINDKTIRVKFDSYHMVAMVGTNRFYCMACKIIDTVRMKTEHCTNEEHLNKMKDWTVVTEYSDFYIRKNTEATLYHCGLCNYLQLRSDIKEHLEYRHEKEYEIHKEKKKNSSKLNNNQKEHKNYNQKSKNSSKINVNNNQNIDYDKNKQTLEHNLPKYFNNTPKKESNTKIKLYNNDIEKIQLFRTLSVCISNETFSIALQSYYVILRFKSQWNCGLCNIILDTNWVLDHVVEMDHTKRMEESPFIQCLGFNFIRLVKNRFFCTLCNTFIDKILLNDHLNSISHTYMLNSELFDECAKPVLVLNESDIFITDLHNEYVRSIVDANILENAYKRKPNVTEKNKEIHEEENQIDISQESESQSEDDDILNTSIDSIEDTYTEEKIYLKINKIYGYIYNSSYHSLMPIDNRFFCFNCNEIVFDIKKHVDGRQHLENLMKIHFIGHYGSHFIRQLYLMYHCAICNVIIPKSFLTKHLNGLIHLTLRMDAILKKIPANEDSIEIKTQKEEIYLKHTEIPYKIVLHAKIIPKKNEENYIKLNKLVFIKDEVVKLSWDAYHSIVALEEVFHCLLCQMSFFDSVIHVKSNGHKEKLVNNEFLSKFGVNLLRKIDSTKINCAICNTQLFDSAAMIEGHLRGKDHVRNLGNFKKSAKTENYNDCDSEAIMI